MLQNLTALLVAILALAMNVLPVLSQGMITGSTTWGSPLYISNSEPVPLSALVGQQRVDFGGIVLDGTSNTVEISAPQIKAIMNLNNTAGSLTADLAIAQVSVNSMGSGQRHFLAVEGGFSGFQIRLELDFEPGMRAVTSSTAMLSPPDTPYTIKITTPNGRTWQHKGVASTAPPSAGPPPNPSRTPITFAGRSWKIRNWIGGPAPESKWTTHADDIGVDANGWLHMGIKYRDGSWQSSEVNSQTPAVYGEYRFKIQVNGSSLGEIDRHIVISPFLYASDTKEIDIEFGRWGSLWPWYKNTQFVTQPYSTRGNRHRFNVEEIAGRSTHVIVWRQDRIDFFSAPGFDDSDLSRRTDVQHWVYTGTDIPTEQDAPKVMINSYLWNLDKSALSNPDKSYGLDLAVMMSYRPLAEIPAATVDFEESDLHGDHPNQSVVFVMDTSGSMSEPLSGGTGTRIDAAKSAARTMIGKLSDNTECALVAYYGCDVRVIVDFTTDKNLLLSTVDQFSPDGSTPLAASIEFATEYMRTHASSRNMDLVLLSDGVESCGGDPVAAASQVNGP